MVQDWQVLAVAVTVLIAVLTLYGTLIKRNYDITSLLKQRLLGADEDETDDGFIHETEQRFDQLEGKMERHSRQTHRQLYAVDRKVNILVSAIADSEVNGELPTESLDDVPPPEGRDFLRGGGAGDSDLDPDAAPDGGEPIHPDNPQENSGANDES